MKTTNLPIVSICTVVLAVAAAGATLALQHTREAVTLAASAGSGPGVSAVDPTPSTQPPVTTTTSIVATTTTPPAATLGRGATGAEVAALQQRLTKLGYWSGYAEGSYGLLTEQAVTAFQKVEGAPRTGIADPATRAALATATRPVAASTAGDLIEIDKARQVLFVIRHGAVAWTLNTSTGTGKQYQVNGRTALADTPVGRWTISRVVDGADPGALGSLYRPRYFHPDGIAVHGYTSVPAYPASHGCVRVTNAAIDWIWADNLMPIGTVVWIH